MDRSSITYTRGKRWWLERVTINGNQRYPDIIKVGELEKGRLYIPEKRYAKLSKVAREMFGELTTEWLSLDDIKRYHDQLKALGVLCDD